MKDDFTQSRFELDNQFYYIDSSSYISLIDYATEICDSFVLVIRLACTLASKFACF